MTDDDAPPPIPVGPPWPADFVAALHAGCYDDETAVDPQRDPMIGLWNRVCADPDAARMLDELDEVRAALGRLGRRRR